MFDLNRISRHYIHKIIISNRKPKQLHVIVFLIITAAFIINTKSTLAQNINDSNFRITKIDTTRFPEVKVYVLGQNLDVDIQQLSVKVEQDGIEYPTSPEIVTIGTQIGIIIDTSESIKRPGLTGDPRYIEIGNVINRLIGFKKLDVQHDWLAAFTFENDKLIKFHDWTHDHQAVANSIYLFEPAQKLSFTPLFDLLYNSLQQFDVKNIDPALQRVIVVFSDGIDVISSLKLEDIVNLAREKNIIIYTVMLGPSNREARSNLERIAIRTGGRYYELKSLDALDEMWDRILIGRQQMVLSYRSRAGTANQIKVSALLPDKQILSATSSINVNISPILVDITYPPQGFDLIRKSDVYTTPLIELEPRILPIKLAFRWPNEVQRTIKRVEFIINNDTHIIENEPFDQFAFPVERFGTGRYTLRVRVIDEFDIVSEAIPIFFTITVDQPPAPTPTPIIEQQVIERVIGVSWASYAALIIGILALLLAIILFFRKPERREAMTTFVTGTIKTLTERIVLRDKQAIPEPRARLIIIGNFPDLPSPVMLQGIRKFGRDPALADVVLKHSLVSRYHCRIVQESDETFRIYDEGSTNGTYVNNNMIGMSGQILQPNDIISIGPITYRFELLRDEEKINEEDKTEVFLQMNETSTFIEQHDNE
jgi:hypothetical protein